MPEGRHVDHPLIEPGGLEARPYQTDLVEAASEDHTLVSLPTGLGKTAVSLRVSAQRLEEHPDGRALLLAPTKPLVEQHAAFYRDVLRIPEGEIVVFTGETAPEDRAALFEDARVIVATPQVIENDLVGNRIDLSSVVYLTVDECHRATGDYPYEYIATRYHAESETPLVTGMSASPGDDEQTIRTVMANLGLRRIAVKTESDPDVAAYTHETDLEWKHVTLPDEILEIRDRLQDVLRDRLRQLKEMGVGRTTDPAVSQSDLQRIRSKLQSLIDRDDSKGYEGMSIHAEVMKIKRAVELVETQSVAALAEYFERQKNAARSSGASKASKRFVSDPKIRRAMQAAQEYDGLHPKFSEVRVLLVETLGMGNGERVIVFTESRDTAESLTEFLEGHFSVRRFVGQTDTDGSDGMTQTEQTETLEAFRRGEFEVLVSTSVAEEGLDVPDVDLVCFFEPVPNAIRSIQRKGRTGRQSEGRVVVLVAEDTRDEAFYWISRRREQEMAEELENLRDVAEDLEAEFTDEQADLGAFAEPARAPDQAASEPGLTAAAPEKERSGIAADGDEEGTDPKAPKTSATPGKRGDQVGIDEFDGAESPAEAPAESSRDETVEESTPRETVEESTPRETVEESTPRETVPEPAAEEGVEIVIDQRELDSSIARDLSTREGVQTRLETLEVGDYVLSDRVAVERKTIGDFLSTLFGEDRDLFEQVGDLVRYYDRAVLIIEGEGDLYTERNAEPNAIRGALASLAVDFEVSILRARHEKDTAAILEKIASREQTDRDRAVSLHGASAAKTLKEQQEYVIAAITDIGPVTAQRLLSELGSVEAVLTAEEETLRTVDGVGPVTAQRIREVAESEYDD